MQKGTVINVLNSLIFWAIPIVYIVTIIYTLLSGNINIPLNLNNDEIFYIIPVFIILILPVIFAAILSLLAFKKCNLNNKTFVISFIVGAIMLVSVWFSVFLFIPAIIYIIGFFINLKKGDKNAKRNGD